MKITLCNILFVFSLLIVMCTADAMLTPKEQLLKMTRIAVETAIGNMPRQIITAQKNLKKNDEPFDLTGLPKEMQTKIKTLAIMGANAESLQVAAYTINSLAQVNQELNNLINTPEYCLTIIKSLAKRFDVADMVVCKTLQTSQAKIQQDLQQRLYDLCLNLNISKHNLEARLVSLYLQKADINFTYHENQVTPLIIAIYANPVMALALLDMPTIDPELTEKDGITPLSIAKAEKNQELIKKLQNKIAQKHTKK